MTGSRTWDDPQFIYDRLREMCAKSHPGTLTVVHGGCPKGADAIAHDWCWQWAGHANEEVHPADWEKHGKAAGYVRNREMVVSGAGIVLAFIRGNSPGASHCAREADAAGLAVATYEYVDRGRHYGRVNEAGLAWFLDHFGSASPMARDIRTEQSSDGFGDGDRGRPYGGDDPGREPEPHRIRVTAP